MAPSAQKTTAPVLAPGGKGQAQVQFKPDGTYQLVRKPSTQSAQLTRSTPSTANASPSTGKTVPNTGHGSAGNAGGGNGVIDAVGKFASGFGSALKDNVEGIINLPQTIWSLMQSYGDTVYCEYQQHIAKGGTAETFNTASPAGTLGKAIGKSVYVETRQSVQAIMDGDAEKLGRFAGDIAFAVATGAAAKGVGVVGKGAALSDEAVALSKGAQKAPKWLGQAVGAVDDVVRGIDKLDDIFTGKSRMTENNGMAKDGISTSWYNQDGSIHYPPNNGAVPGTEQIISLRPGDMLGRYGNIGDKSNFVTQAGADPTKLSLPPDTNPRIYQEFVVVKEIPDVVRSKIEAWGTSAGGGLQYELPKPIKELIKQGYIVPK